MREASDCQPLLADEAKRRLEKVDEARQQQVELHAARLQAAKYAVEEARVNSETALLKRDLALLELEEAKLRIEKLKKELGI
jgi:hypothetical protein